MKNSIEEKVEDVMWLTKSYELAARDMFPLTPRIATILNKERRVKVFHVTSPSKVSKLAALQGTKKSISAMTKVGLLTTHFLQGVWENGILFYLEGTLILDASKDVNSVPDENGRRWILLSEIDDDLQEDFNSYIQQQDKLASLYQKVYNYVSHQNTDGTKIGVKPVKELNEFLKMYIDVATKFAEDYAQNIVEGFAEQPGDSSFLSGDYNEVIVNNIQLIDAIYDIKQIPKDIDRRKKVIGDMEAAITGKLIPIDWEDGLAVDNVKTFIKKRGGVTSNTKIK
jgi:hypothetical protein